MKLAIYDFDGTLFEKDTLPFIVKYWGSNGYSKKTLIKFYINITKLLAIYKLKLDKNMDKEKFRTSAAEIFMYLFEKMTKDEITEFFAKCSIEITKHFNQKVIDSIHSKKSEGYHMVICSGANTLLLKEATKHLPFDTIIGTELSFLEDQTYNYKAPPVIITGVNKPKALLERFEGIDIDFKSSFAYGDSYYDHDILALTGNPVAVNPDTKLREIAIEKDWTIL